MNSSVAPLFLLPHSLSKLKLPMNCNAIFKNVKVVGVVFLSLLIRGAGGGQPRGTLPQISVGLTFFGSSAFPDGIASEPCIN